MRQLLIIISVAALASCNPKSQGRTNIDYFVISEIDTRKGVDFNIALLKDGKKNVFSPTYYAYEGTDPKTGAHVIYNVTDNEILSVSYPIPVNLWSPDGEEVKSVELKYGFDKLKGREETRFPNGMPGFVIEYNCLEKGLDDECSIKVDSRPAAKNGSFYILWMNLPLLDKLAKERITKAAAKLP